MQKINLLLSMMFLFCNIIFFKVQGTSQNQSSDDVFTGFYTTFEVNKTRQWSVMPQAWIYYNQFYYEMRYNYEDIKTASLYFGIPLNFNQKTEIEFVPLIGGFYGQSNGISAGFNLTTKYRLFTTNTQFQYSINISQFDDNFLYDWTTLNFGLNKYFGIGAGFQVYFPRAGEQYFKAGPLLSFNVKSFGLELIAYNLWNDDMSIAFGISYEL